MKRNIVIIHKSGGDFKLTDVYLLVSHINKYWNKEITKPDIYCYSDMVKYEISVVGLTIRPLPNPQWVGWWSKLNLFSPELAELRPFLYLDIDTVVLKSIDTLFPPVDKNEVFITLRDFYRPTALASGVMFVPFTNAMDNIYKEWMKGPAVHIRRFTGDQNFIQSVVTNPDLFWQDISTPDYITTFKPKKIWRTELPINSAVVCFHGKPRIPEAAKTVKWVESYVTYEI